MPEITDPFALAVERVDVLLMDVLAGGTSLADDRSLTTLTEQLAVENALIEARTHLFALIEARDGEVERRKIPIRMCQCTESDISMCPVHTVDHPYREGCCAEPEDAHRHMTTTELAEAYPVIFDERVTVEGLGYRVDARRFNDGVGVTLTQLFPGDADDDGSGLCFDLSLEAVRAVLPLLARLAESN